MNILDIARLVSIIQGYKRDLKEMFKGEQIKGLDIFTFKAFGKTFHLSLYIDCVKDS